MVVQTVERIILPERPAALHYYSKLQMASKLVISTYELEGSNRKGSLWFLDDEHNKVNLSMSAGVFRFELFPDGETLIASLTNGSLSVVNLKTLSASDLLITADSMLLSISLFQERALTSDNHGSVHIIDLRSEKRTSFNAARLKYTNEPCEVWCTSWHNNGNDILSGGEDGLLKLWDVRSNHQFVACNSSHESGVTFVKSEDSWHFITGSYDEHIRRFDIRNFQKPVLQGTLGGGVWNVEEMSDSRLLAACMYNGWAVLNSTTFSILSRKEDAGEFILYGATQCGDPSLIASCTFNNNTVYFDRIIS